MYYRYRHRQLLNKLKFIYFFYQLLLTYSRYERIVVLTLSTVSFDLSRFESINWYKKSQQNIAIFFNILLGRSIPGGSPERIRSWAGHSIRGVRGGSWSLLGVRSGPVL